MRTGKIVCYGLFIFFFIAVSSYGADVAKIGVVDFQKILQTSVAGKKAMTEINKKGEELKTDLENKGKELDEMKNNLERELMVLEKKKIEEKEREFRIKVGDFKALEQKYSNELRSLNMKLSDRIRKDIFDLAETMGKKEGYLLILEKREAGVIYSPTTIDVTDKLIQQFNAKSAQAADDTEKTKKK